MSLAFPPSTGRNPVWSRISNALKRLGFRSHNFLTQLLSETSRERSRDVIPLSPCRAELISSRGNSAPLRGSRRRETHGQKNGGRHHRGLGADSPSKPTRSEEHTSELQS